MIWGLLSTPRDVAPSIAAALKYHECPNEIGAVNPVVVSQHPTRVGIMKRLMMNRLMRL